MRELDEAALIEALKAGDDDAFEHLVRTFGGRLLSLARRYLGRGEDAHDAVQEAFIAASRAIKSFQGNSMLSTWLHQITINACLMKIRSRRRRPEESIEDLLPGWREDGHHMVPPRDWDLPGDQTLERDELRAQVRECIQRLPEGYRAVLLLRDIEEKDTKETAALLGISENGAKVRLHRARQALRTLLDQKIGVPA